ADASAEESRRAAHGLRQPDRPGLAVAQVQAGPASVEPPPVLHILTNRTHRFGRSLGLIVCLVLATALAASSVRAQTSPSPSASLIPVRAPSLTAAGAILEDFDTGKVLFSKAPRERRPGASPTKGMPPSLGLS